MGLDMYLEKRRKNTNDELQHVIYWRKANAIHNYFDSLADGLENLQCYDVSFEDIKELKSIIVKVLNNHSLASELLPTQPGFFFGNYDYDCYYFEKLKHTLDELEKITKEDFEQYDFVYFAWW